MPAGKGLLSSKDFALQVADEGFFFPWYQKMKNLSSRIPISTEKFSAHMINRINCCTIFA